MHDSAMRHPARPFGYVTPWGPVTLYLAGGVCHAIRLVPCGAAPAPAGHPLVLWLDACFYGGGEVLLPLMAPARTAFQHRLRHVLLEIPKGETRSYGELAKALGTGARAVGQALGANPLPILVPCHRIVAAHGPGGFSCGLAWKRRLLAFEGVIL